MKRIILLLKNIEHRVLSNKWIDVAAKMPPDMELPVDISDIDITEEGSAMHVLNRIKQAQTEFFAMYEDEVIRASDIGTLNGREWKAIL